MFAFIYTSTQFLHVYLRCKTEAKKTQKQSSLHVTHYLNICDNSWKLWFYIKIHFPFFLNQGNPTRKETLDKENLDEMEMIPFIIGKDKYQMESTEDSFDPIDRTSENVFYTKCFDFIINYWSCLLFYSLINNFLYLKPYILNLHARNCVVFKNRSLKLSM